MTLHGFVPDYEQDDEVLVKKDGRVGLVEENHLNGYITVSFAGGGKERFCWDEVEPLAC